MADLNKEFDQEQDFNELSDAFDQESDVESTFDQEQEIQQIPEETPSQLGAALRSGAQGLTFGLSDELAGAGEAALDVAGSDFELKDLIERYKTRRDESRGLLKAGEEEYPATTTAAEIIGGIAPALATGGASAAGSVAKTGLKALPKLIKEGAKFGALYGAGKSEAELLEGEGEEFAGDVGKEALIGAAAGPALLGTGKAIVGGTKAALSPAAKLGRYIHDKSPAVEKIVTATKEAAEGAKILGKKHITSNLKQLEGIINNTLRSKESGILKGAEILDNKVTEIAKKLDVSGEKVDVSDDIRNLFTYVDEALDNKVLGDDVKGKLIDFKVALGKYLDLNKAPSERAIKEAGEEASQMIKRLQGREALQTGSVSKYEPIYDKNARSYFIKKGKDVVGEVPIKSSKDLSNYEVNKKLMSAEELNDMRKWVNNLASQNNEGAVRDIFTRSRQLIKENISGLANKVGDREYKNALEKQSLFYETLNSVFPSINALSKNPDDQKKIISVIRDFARKAADPENIVEKEGIEGYSNFINKMDEIFPGFIDQHGNKILKKARHLYLGEEVYGGSGSIGPRGIVGEVLSGAERVGIGIGAGVGSLTHKLSSLGNFDKAKYIRLSQKAIEQYPGERGQRLANFFGKLAETSDNTAKNALLFSASQQPAFKNALSDMLPFISELENE